jgi:hypothetical protein
MLLCVHLLGKGQTEKRYLLMLQNKINICAYLWMRKMSFLIKIQQEYELGCLKNLLELTQQ